MRVLQHLSAVAFGVAALVGAGSTVNAGTLYFSEDDNSNGLFSLNTTTGAATPIGMTNVNSSTVGLTESADPTFLYGSQFDNTLVIQADGSGAVVLGPAASEAMAFDPTTGTLYGGINGEFFTISTATGEIVTNLASPDADIEGLAYGNGVIYGLAGFGGPRGNLYSYDIGLNAWSLIGFSGIQFNLPGLAFDPLLNVLYAKGSQDTLLYAIDPTTAAATVIGDTGLSGGGGLAFVPGAIPEPGTVGLLAIGLGSLGSYHLRRRRGAAL